MNDIYKKLEMCLKSVRTKTDFQPEVALILGSGLGDYADGIQIEQTVDYTEIEGFPGRKEDLCSDMWVRFRSLSCRDASIIMKDIRCLMWCFRPD